jgi:hypothetical protein
MTTLTEQQPNVASPPAGPDPRDFLVTDGLPSSEGRLVRDPVRTFGYRDLAPILPDAYTNGQLPEGFPAEAHSAEGR